MLCGIKGKVRLKRKNKQAMRDAGSRDKVGVTFQRKIPAIDLICLYIFFPNTDHVIIMTQENWSFVLFIKRVHASMNMSACTLYNEDKRTKQPNLLRNLV